MATEAKLESNTKQVPTVNYMIDIETLGTRNTSVILSIGICTFGSPDLNKECMYHQLNYKMFPTSTYEFTTDEDTKEWWKAQPEQTWREATCGTLAPIVSLGMISSVLAKTNAIVWTKGNFDLPILEHAFNFYGVPVPWTFRNTRDFRTIKALWPALNLTPDPNAAHSAIYDAIFQATYLETLATEHGIPGVFL